MKLTTRIRLSAMMFLNLFIRGSWFVTLGAIIAPFITGMVEGKYTTADSGHDWKSIWLVPALFALLVFLIFALMFRGRKKIADTESKVEQGLAYSPIM